METIIEVQRKLKELIVTSPFKHLLFIRTIPNTKHFIIRPKSRPKAMIRRYKNYKVVWENLIKKIEQTGIDCDVKITFSILFVYMKSLKTMNDATIPVPIDKSKPSFICMAKY